MFADAGRTIRFHTALQFISIFSKNILSQSYKKLVLKFLLVCDQTKLREFDEI